MSARETAVPSRLRPAVKCSSRKIRTATSSMASSFAGKYHRLVPPPETLQHDDVHIHPLGGGDEAHAANPKARA